MTKSQIWICIILGVVCGAFVRGEFFRMPSAAQAADVAPQPTLQPPCDVALLDVAKVFKNCNWFRDKMEEMKKASVDAEKELKLRTVVAEKLAERLKEMKTGSDEHNALQREIIGQQADNQLYTARKQQSILSDEARLYAEVYERVQQETTKIAREKRIRLVLRFQTDAIDKDKRDSVLQGVNRPVIYQDGLDITDAVIAAINAQ
jgi:fumarylacetoacetate (FAA) hydrolase family protein